MIARVWLDTRKRGQARWCIIYTDWAGHRHREQTGAQSRAEAKALLAAKLSEVAQEKARGGPLVNMTFKEFVETEFLPHCQAINTRNSYKTKVAHSNTLFPLFGDRRLRDITHADIKRFMAERRLMTCPHKKKPYQPATINRHMMFMSAVFREAWDREYVDANP